MAIDTSNRQTNPELSAADKVAKVNSLLRAAGAMAGFSYGEVVELTQFVSSLPAEVARLKGLAQFHADDANRLALNVTVAMNDRDRFIAERDEARSEIARLQGELAEARTELDGERAAHGKTITELKKDGARLCWILFNRTNDHYPQVFNILRDVLSKYDPEMKHGQSDWWWRKHMRTAIDTAIAKDSQT